MPVLRGIFNDLSLHLAARLDVGVPPQFVHLAAQCGRLRAVGVAVQQHLGGLPGIAVVLAVDQVLDLTIQSQAVLFLVFLLFQQDHLLHLPGFRVVGVFCGQLPGGQAGLVPQSQCHVGANLLAGAHDVDVAVFLDGRGQLVGQTPGLLVVGVAGLELLEQCAGGRPLGGPDELIDFDLHLFAACLGQPGPFVDLLLVVQQRVLVDFAQQRNDPPNLSPGDPGAEIGPAAALARQVPPLGQADVYRRIVVVANDHRQGQQKPGNGQTREGGCDAVQQFHRGCLGIRQGPQTDNPRHSQKEPEDGRHLENPGHDIGPR